MSWLDRTVSGSSYAYDDAGQLVAVTDGGGRKPASTTTGRSPRQGDAPRRSVCLLRLRRRPARIGHRSQGSDDALLLRRRRPNDPGHRCKRGVLVDNAYDDQGRVISQTDAARPCRRTSTGRRRHEADRRRRGSLEDTYNEQRPTRSRTDPLGEHDPLHIRQLEQPPLLHRRARQDDEDELRRAREHAHAHDAGRGNRKLDLRRGQPCHQPHGSARERQPNEYDANGNLVKETDSSRRGHRDIPTTTRARCTEPPTRSANDQARLRRQRRSCRDDLAERGEDDDALRRRGPHGRRDRPAGNEPGADPAAYTTSYQYDAAGNLTRHDRSNGTRRDTAYDQAGNVASETDAKGNVTRYEYDEAGHKTAEIAPDGGVTHYTYDILGKHLIAETDPLGNVTRYRYDAAGRQTASPRRAEKPPPTATTRPATRSRSPIRSAT